MKRGENLRKHGLTKSPEHRSWLSMMTRCLWNSPKREDWHLYQGRGITVCERWQDFRNFLADMGSKPTPKHTIDRINSDGNYEPGNCKWSTPKEQARNWKHRNRLYTLNGTTKTLAEWLEQIGLAGASFRDRLKNGWALDKALTVLPRHKREKTKNGTFKAISV